jgi:hypothetical protein
VQDGDGPAANLESLIGESRRLAGDAQRVTDDAGTKVIKAVKELLTSFPTPGNEAGRQEGAPSSDRSTLSAITEMMQSPNDMVQYQSLAMLAATVRWFGRETGRSEDEILEGLAANYRH